MKLIQIIKALSDETRLRILNLLSKGELCVCEIEYLLNINQSNASRHLNRLTVSGLVEFEKRALYVYYSINKSLHKEYPHLTEFISKELNLDKFKIDEKRLEIYKKSGMSCEDLKQGKTCFHSNGEEI
jgi:ArsR family transcriptional regulator